MQLPVEFSFLAKAKLYTIKTPAIKLQYFYTCVITCLATVSNVQQPQELVASLGIRSKQYLLKYRSLKVVKRVPQMGPHKKSKQISWCNPCWISGRFFYVTTYWYVRFFLIIHKIQLHQMHQLMQKLIVILC